MTILHFPAAILFLAAAAAAVLGRTLKKRPALSYIGGLCWAAGAVLALVDGVSLQELLAVTLLLLFIAGVPIRKGGAP